MKYFVIIIMLASMLLIYGCATRTAVETREPIAEMLYSHPYKKVYFAALKAIPTMAWEIEESSLDSGIIIANRRDGFGASFVLYVKLSIMAKDNYSSIVKATIDGSGYVGGDSELKRKLPKLFSNISDLLRE